MNICLGDKYKNVLHYQEPNVKKALKELETLTNDQKAKIWAEGMAAGIADQRALDNGNDTGSFYEGNPYINKERGCWGNHMSLVLKQICWFEKLKNFKKKLNSLKKKFGS